MYTGLEGQVEQDQWVKLLPFTLIVIWYFSTFLCCFLMLTLFQRLTVHYLHWLHYVQFLVAHIKKAIADVESGNVVTFATGKVQIYSVKDYLLAISVDSRHPFYLALNLLFTVRLLEGKRKKLQQLRKKLELLFQSYQ